MQIQNMYLSNFFYFIIISIFDLKIQGNPKIIPMTKDFGMIRHLYPINSTITTAKLISANFIFKETKYC